MNKRISVIGSGIATAIRLQQAGCSVDVYEANDYFGGKLSEFHLGSYSVG